MSELGRNGITLTAVSDACSVVFSPSSCVVHADFDGSNPVLTYAYTDINVVRGDVKLAITTSNITIPSRSNNNITYSLTAIDTYTVRLQITAIPTTILNGSLGVKVTLGAFEILSSFPFTVVRESSMLDWIQDWDGRRTSIGGSSIVTPKIFAGAKDSDNSLTGVYLGPDTAGAGIYGYKAVADPTNEGHTITSEVFHINSNGASIGGWNIETGGITTVDSVSGYSLQLLSSGSIIAKDDNDATIYALYRSGEASFAKGNVLFHADGSAKFVGEIQAGSGKIGNWLISENAIHKAHVVLDSNVSAIMILAADNYQNTANAYIAALKMYGGVKMYYTSSGDYGMEAWLPATEETVGDAVVTQYHQAFALGSSNFIAGWHFDDEKLYGTYAMIVGTNGNAGLYVSSSDISGVAVSGLTTNIAAGTGIYITAHNNFHELAGYAGGNLIFRLGTNGHRIAGWKFDNTHIWSGSDLCNNDGFTQSSGSVIIGSSGILAGPAWRFEADGSGKLAGGKIAWDASGNLTFLGGTVKSGSSNNPAWILNPDGTGHFASGNLTIATNSLTLSGALTVNGGCVQLDNAGICSEGSNNTSIRFWAGCSHSNRNNEVGSTNGPKFKVTQGGSLYASDAHITGEIQATSGKIGGFTITGSYIQNYSGSSQYDLDAALIFSDNNGIWAAIGTNTVSVTTGLQVPMAIRNHQNDDFGLSTNYAGYFSARNAYVNIAINAVAEKGSYSYDGNYNYALLGTGNCVVSGASIGYGVSTDVITTANVVRESAFYNNNFLIVSSSQSSSHYALPTLSSIRSFIRLSSGSNTPFHVRIYYLVNNSSANIPRLYGRNTTIKDGNDTAWMDDNKYPYLYNTAGNQVDYVGLSKTKPVMIELWYDGSNYKACAINA